MCVCYPIVVIAPSDLNNIPSYMPALEAASVWNQLFSTRFPLSNIIFPRKVITTFLALSSKALSLAQMLNRTTIFQGR